jgi:hypothetical protein
MKTDLTLTVANLDNLAPDVQIQALEELSEAVVVLVEKAVDTLKSSPHPFLVAERLNLFGSLVIEPLERLINSDVSSETKILASLVLLQFGSKVGLPYLLEAIVTDHNYACLATGHLVKAGVTEVGDRIIARLRLCQLEEVDLILCLVQGLKDLGIQLPSDARTRFTSPGAPNLLRVGLRKIFGLET